MADTSNLVAPATFKRDPLNAPALAEPQSNYNLTDVLAMMESQAPGNEVYQAAHQVDLEAQLDRSPTAWLKTKVVEAQLATTTSSQVQAPEAVIFNHWVAYAADGTYTGSFQFTPPGTSIPIQLNQQQAVALWIYALNKALEPSVANPDFQDITMVPRVGALNVTKRVIPTFDVLRSTTTSVVSDALLNQALSLAVPVPTHLTSVTAFSNFTTAVYAAQQQQFLLYSFQNDPLARAQLQYVTESFYYKAIFNTLPSLTLTSNPYVGESYITLLSTIGFTPSNYSRLDYYNLTTTLYEAATGADFNAVSDPINIQAAMIELLRTLSSYSIQIVSQTNQAAVTSISHPDIRIYDVLLGEQEISLVSGAKALPSLGPIVDNDVIRFDWNELFPQQAPVMLGNETRFIDQLSNQADALDLHPTLPWMMKSSVQLASSFDPQVQYAALSPTQQAALAALPWPAPPIS